MSFKSLLPGLLFALLLARLAWAVDSAPAFADPALQSKLGQKHIQII